MRIQRSFLGVLLVALAFVLSCGENPAGPDLDNCPGPNCPGNPDPDPGPGPGPNPPPSGAAGPIIGFGLYGNGHMDIFEVSTSGTFAWVTTDQIHKGWPAVSRDGQWLAIASTEGECGDVSVAVMPHSNTARSARVEVIKISGTCVANDGGAQTLGWLADNRTIAYIGIDAQSEFEQRLVVFYIDRETGETWMSWLPQGMSLDAVSHMDSRRLFPSGNEVEARSLVPSCNGRGILIRVTDGTVDQVWRVDREDGFARMRLLTTSAEKNPTPVDCKSGVMLLVGHDLTGAEDPRYSSHSLYEMQEAVGAPITLVKQTADPGIESATFCGSNICYLDWSRGMNQIHKVARDGTELEPVTLAELDQIFDIKEVR